MCMCVLQDVDTLDATMPDTVRAWIYCVINSMAILFVITYVVPLFAAVIIPLLVIYFIVLVRLTWVAGKWARPLHKFAAVPKYISPRTSMFVCLFVHVHPLSPVHVHKYPQLLTV